MLRAWCRATLVALTAGAAIAAQLAGVAPAQAAGTAITIAATSKIGPVTGYVVVEYRGGKDASARIHGTITGATAGEVATLYAQSFPYAKAPAPVGSATLRAAGTTAYSFSVTPTLATRYKVKLFARKTAARPLATSPVKNVYVSFGGTMTTSGPCGPPTCHVTSHVFLIVPSSALKVEMSKRFFAYFAVKFGPPHGPTPPLPTSSRRRSGSGSSGWPKRTPRCGGYRAGTRLRRPRPRDGCCTCGSSGRRRTRSRCGSTSRPGRHGLPAETQPGTLDLSRLKRGPVPAAGARPAVAAGWRAARWW